MMLLIVCFQFFVVFVIVEFFFLFFFILVTIYLPPSAPRQATVDLTPPQRRCFLQKQTTAAPQAGTRRKLPNLWDYELDHESQPVGRPKKSRANQS
jgi:hypothetical protein